MQVEHQHGIILRSHATQARIQKSLLHVVFQLGQKRVCLEDPRLSPPSHGYLRQSNSFIRGELGAGCDKSKGTEIERTFTNPEN